MKTFHLSFVALVAICSAFQVEFYVGEDCTSSEQYSNSFHYNENVCHHVTIDNAMYAAVARQPRDKSNQVVAFYSSADCDKKNIIASTDSGCVGPLDPVGFLKNEYFFTVLENYNGKRDEDDAMAATRSADKDPQAMDPDWQIILARSPEDEKTLKDANRNGTGSLNPDWDPDVFEGTDISHGAIEHDLLGHGRSVRWQQVAKGVFQGIPLDEWDDDVHTKSDDIMEYGDTYPWDASANHGHINVGLSPDADLDSLAERADFRGICTGAAQCTRILYDRSRPTLAAAWGSIVNAALQANARLHTSYTNVNDYLHAHPIRVSLVGGFGVGVAVTALTNKALSSQAQSCTGSITTTVIQTMTYTVGQSANVGESRTTYDASGSTLVQVAGEVSPKDNLDKKGYCGAPKTGGRRTKRSLMSYLQAMRL